MGGGTTRVGDPSGNGREPQAVFTIEQIDAKQGRDQEDLPPLRELRRRRRRRRHGRLIAEWLTKLNYIEFLRDVGPALSPSTACSPSISVKLRLEREHELSFLEFNYMILQGL